MTTHSAFAYRLGKNRGLAFWKEEVPKKAGLRKSRHGFTEKKEVQKESKKILSGQKTRSDPGHQRRAENECRGCPGIFGYMIPVTMSSISA